jgi:hypothetical protein
MARIGSLLKNSHKSITGNIVDNHVILDIVESEVHYWSPQLNFRLEESDENPKHTIVQGLIGPRPAVWTLFMFIYFSVGILGFFVASFGLCRWMLGEFSSLVWALPIAVLFMLTAYKAGKYGEQLGADQIELLKHFVREALAKPENNTKEIP